MRNRLLISLLLAFVSLSAFSQSQDKIIEQIKQLSGQINMEDDTSVRRHINVYLSNKTKTASIIQKSYHYFPEITDSLEKYKLPIELRFLTMALSEFNHKKVSEDGGSGIWQMKYIPARNHGVRITSYIDYRRDFRVETGATAAYFLKLKNQFDDWRLCILAYYSDPIEVQKAIKKAGANTDFASIANQMPAKYKHIIPKFIAAAYIFTYADQLNLPAGNAQELPPLMTVNAEKWTTLYQISKAIDVPVNVLEEANPIFKKGVVPHASYTYDIFIPRNKADKFYEMGDSLYTFPTHADVNSKENQFNQTRVTKPKTTKPVQRTTNSSGKKMLYYTVRSGDVLGKISDLYDVRVSDIRRWNGIRGDRINVGQKLKIYVSASRYSHYSKMNRMSSSQKAKIRAKD